ncbi:hypothetical protein MKX03_009785, partial [Papaver bracteatum]
TGVGSDEKAYNISLVNGFLLCFILKLVVDVDSAAFHSCCLFLSMLMFSHVDYLPYHFYQHHRFSSLHCFSSADQVADVLDYFGLGAVMCLGVTSGAYILTLFAMKYRDRVLGLILVSPLFQGTSWKEWLYNKFMLNLLYFYGMCGIMKECLLQRYFSKEVRGGPQVPESDIVQACITLLDERKSENVSRFLQAINENDIKVDNYCIRYDLTGGLKKLRCRTLIFVGDESPYHSEALHMAVNLDRRYSALVEVQACGSMVTEEHPHAMLIPLEYFFMGYGLYRPVQLSGSPRSPLSPSCISP